MKESRSWRLKTNERTKKIVFILHIFSSLPHHPSFCRSVVSFENRNNRVLSCSVHTSKCQTMKTKSLPTILSFYLALCRSLSLSFSFSFITSHCVCTLHTNRHTHILLFAASIWNILHIKVYGWCARARSLCMLPESTNRACTHCCT